MAVKVFDGPRAKEVKKFSFHSEIYQAKLLQSWKLNLTLAKNFLWVSSTIFRIF